MAFKEKHWNGYEMLQQLKFSLAENIQITSTLSNWELDGLIFACSAPKGPVAERSRAGENPALLSYYHWDNVRYEISLR